MIKKKLDLNSVRILGSGPVAQSVEQRIENPCVGGSIPPQATNLMNPSSRWVFLWSNAGIAQLVERNLAKVEVESSRLFSRSIWFSMSLGPSIVMGFLYSGEATLGLAVGEVRLVR
jgi:hypothetical protein